MRNLAPLIIILLSLFLLFISLGDNRGLMTLVKLRSQLSALNEKNSYLKSEINEIDSKIADLKNDFILEKHSREDLGLLIPGEFVYTFKDTTKDKPDIKVKNE